MKKVFYIILISISLIVLVRVSTIFIYRHFKENNIEQEEFVLDVPMPLEKEVTTIKDGLDVAYEIAKRWDKNALSTSIIARFEGKERIIDKSGLIFYEFSVDNIGLLGNLGKVCYVDLDLKQQAIVEFNSYGEAPDTGHNTPEDFYKSKIDIKEAFEIVEKKLGKETLYKYKDPTVVISAGEKAWIFDFYNEEKKNYSIRIDPNKGEILDITEK